MSLKKSITSFRDNFSACGVARGGKDGHQAKRRSNPMRRLAGVRLKPCLGTSQEQLVGQRTVRYRSFSSQ
jgi:hypothetical protein